MAVFSDDVANYPSSSNTYKITVRKADVYKVLDRSINPLFIGLRLTIRFIHSNKARKLTYIYDPLEIIIADWGIED